MPHLIIEHSDNLPAALLDDLLLAVHETAAGMDLFPTGGLRTRLAPRSHFRIADGNPENAFIHLLMKVGHGRSEEILHDAAAKLFDVVCTLTNNRFDAGPLAISLEVQEIHPRLTFKKNNIHKLMKS